MKKAFSVWFGLFLLLAAACAVESDKVSAGTSLEQKSPEVLVAKAEAKYAEYLQANGGDRMAATQKTAVYLRSLSSVKEVTVRGSDSLFLIMRDGNELLLMLGRKRL
ncbi:MAG: hypothetical protein WCA04_07120 [Geobacteraceae bacterium]